MPLMAALGVLADLRTDEIVVTTMGAAREWPKLSQHALDFHYLPSAMGHAPMIGLGLALAQPSRQTIVFNGDGCMLMSLGCLVTIVASRVQNYTLIVLDNSLFEVTGGQSTAAAKTNIDFANIARAAGFENAFVFDRLEDWRSAARKSLASPGPRFICLRVAPVGAEYQLPTLEPISQRLAAFQSALQAAR
jgi:sulfopyruvate decarboxylase subunit beta